MRKSLCSVKKVRRFQGVKERDVACMLHSLNVMVIQSQRAEKRQKSRVTTLEVTENE